MKIHFRSRKHVVLIISILLIFLSITILAFTTANLAPGCKKVQGRLYNAIAGEGPGRVIGTLKGEYWINLPGEFIDPDETSVVFGYGGPSYIEGKHGRIYFNEYAAIDYEEQIGTNGAVLWFVTGGTGKWENASGYITLSGYYHTNEMTGVWDYQGEVCSP